MSLPRSHTLVLIATCMLAGCSDYFDYTLYTIEPDNHELTLINLERVKAVSLPYFESFRFAVIADSHAYYDELKDFVHHINLRQDIAFLLIAGDLTDYGLQQEYQWSLDQLNDLKPPYLTAIGNHDAINNGKDNYQAFYGAFDYSFTFNQVKFVVLNSASWEFDNTVPRLDWLRDELNSYHLYQHQLVLTHILPQDQRFSGELSENYLAAIKDNFVSLMMGGHNHAYDYFEEILSNGAAVGYLTTGTLKDRGYVVVTVEADKVSYQRQAF